MSLFWRRWLDGTLVVIFVACVIAVVFAHENPFARKWLCGTPSVCPTVSNAAALYKITYDLGIGGLTSLMFYLVLIRLPDFQRRRRIRRSFSGHYRAFKQDLIGTILGVANGTYSFDEVERLIDQKQFRAYFKEKVSSSEDRWHRFLNRLEQRHIAEILTTMEIFRDEISRLLLSTYIADDKPFEFFKRLSAAIYAEKETKAEYDSVK